MAQLIERVTVTHVEREPNGFLHALIGGEAHGHQLHEVVRCLPEVAASASDPIVHLTQRHPARRQTRDERIETSDVGFGI